MAQTVKNVPSIPNLGDLGWIPGSGRSPGEKRKWQPTSIFLPGEAHGQRSLGNHSPGVAEELDTTE